MPAFRSIAMVGWSLSLGLHAGAVAWLVRSPQDLHPATRRPPVSFSVVTSPRSTPNPPRGSESKLPKPAFRTHPAAPLPPKLAAAPKTSAATTAPVDLTGVTLTGGDGASWSSMTGNGQAMLGALRATVVTTPQTSQFTKDAARARPPKSIEPPDLVAVNDLSSKPVPPPLDAQLVRNYPVVAKRQGVAGKAVILARIDRDGVVRSAIVQAESSAGFGAACQRTLLGSQWSAPRDRNGRSVSTQIRYTCDFRVDS